MAKLLLWGMTVSLDGYVNDRQGSVELLYADLEALRETEVLQEAIRDTGAVVMGRRAFEMAEDPDLYADNYEFQVPIFVLTHHPPEKHPRESGGLTFSFVTDGIESAIRQAKAAAGERDVTVIGGAETVRQCIQAGLADELQLDVMPVLLGGGLRLFDDETQRQLLVRTRVIELPGGRTHLSFSFR